LTEAEAAVTFRVTTMHNNFALSPAVATALFWAAALVCGVAHAAIVASVLRSGPRRRLEIAWAVIPALALAAVLVMTWRGMHAST
jgi:heme/copper-type cytochrome/quinol oxidase subunit 2